MSISTQPETLITEVRSKAEQLSSVLLSTQFLVVFGPVALGAYVGPQGAHVLGYCPAAVTPALLEQAVHPDDAPLVLRAARLANEFAAYLSQPRPAAADAPPPAGCASIDYRLRSQAGAYVRVLRQNFVLVPPAEGRPAVLGSLFTDITGHKTGGDVRFSIDHPEFAGWLRSRKAARTPDMLSLREQEILAHLLAGGTTADLCKELFISELTLKTHRRNIHRKMRLHAQVIRSREARS